MFSLVVQVLLLALACSSQFMFLYTSLLLVLYYAVLTIPPVSRAAVSRFNAWRVLVVLIASVCLQTKHSQAFSLAWLMLSAVILILIPSFILHAYHYVVFFVGKILTSNGNAVRPIIISALCRRHGLLAYRGGRTGIIRQVGWSHGNRVCRGTME